MTPKKFYDYLEGKLPDHERQELERALIHDPELQREFVAARQIHRSLQNPPNESKSIARSAVLGRQLAAAFAVLVLANVGIGLYFIFRANRLPAEAEEARQQAMRARVQSALEKSAATILPSPTLATPIVLTIPGPKQDAVAEQIIAAATAAGGSGAKTLPNDNGVSVLVLIPASAEAALRKTLSALGAPPPEPKAAASPNEPVHLEIVLAKPR